MRSKTQDGCNAPLLLVRDDRDDSAAEAAKWLVGGGHVLASGHRSLHLADHIRNLLRDEGALGISMLGDELLLRVA